MTSAQLRTKTQISISRKICQFRCFEMARNVSKIINTEADPDLQIRAGWPFSKTEKVFFGALGLSLV